MADPSTLEGAGKLALGAVGGGGAVLIVLQLLGGLAKGWVSGAPGMEKEIREDLRVEVQRLSRDLAATRDEVDLLRGRVTTLNTQYLAVYLDRARARDTINHLERDAGKPETVWPADPPTPGSPTPGGNP